MAFRPQLLLLAALLFLIPQSSLAAEKAPEHPSKNKADPAILLVTFGTSVPSARAAFTSIEQMVRKAFPTTEIRWAYTSKKIRTKLAREGTVIESPEMALARLMDEGCKQVVIQSLHMIPGAEFHEMYTNGKLFAQMAGGFTRVTVSPPLLANDAAMEKVLDIVTAQVVPKERKPGEAVVLMGHGTHHPSDAIYSALMYKAQKRDPNLFVATVEGSPSFEEVREMLVHKGIKKAYLVPLMTVAGDHALNDMAGEEPDSWKSQLTKVDIESVPVLKGLAEFEPIVELWLDNLRASMQQVR